METPKRAGPTLTETIRAKRLAGFLKKNPGIAEWVDEKIETEEGRRDLRTLVCFELKKSS